MIAASQVETFFRHLFADRATLVFLVVVALALAAGAVVRAGRPDLPYVAAPALLTAAERHFFFALRQAIAAEFQLFAKVRLGDIIEVRGGVSGKRRFAAFGRITSGHDVIARIAAMAEEREFIEAPIPIVRVSRTS